MGDFTDWVFVAEKEYDGKFEEKHKKGLNISRLVCFGVFMVLFFSTLNDDLFNLKNLSESIGVWKYAVFVVILYTLIILYKAWIKSCWEFLKKDSIVHFIFLALIPAIIIFYGYQYIHKGKTEFPPDIFKSEEAKEVKQEYDEIIDRLNGFYSSLFTSVAIVAAVLGITAWRGFKEMKEKLENFKDFEEKVKFVKDKKELAELVQRKFDNVNTKGTSTSIYFDLTEEEKIKLLNIETQILEETTDDSWLKLIYANQLLDKKEITENDFIKIENILYYVESRDLLKEESVIKKKLFHLKGLMYRLWYEYKKSQFRKKNSKHVHIEWKAGWWKKDTVEGEWKYKNTELLEHSIENYEKVIDLCENTSVHDKDVSETLGNLPVVLIELSKFYSNSSHQQFDMEGFRWSKLKEDDKKNIGKDDCLNYAEKCLNENEDQHFSIIWDRARVMYYRDRKTHKEEIKKLIARVRRMIVDKDDMAFFEKTIENEQKEKGLDGNMGFPWDIEDDEKKGFFTKIRDRWKRRK